MNPYLVDFGLFQISWYSVFVLLGLFVGGTLLFWEAKRFSINPDFLSNLIFWTTIFAVIGSRLYFVAFNFEYYQANPLEIFRIWEGGLAIHGAILFGFIFVLSYTRRYKVSLLRILDIIVPSLIIGQAIGRWGNFFNQEAFGSEVSRAFLESLRLPNFIVNGMNIDGIYYHPTFLYESIWCVLGFILLIIVRRFYKYLKKGQLTAIYFMWYSLGRFFIEALRTDSLMVGDFKIAQIVSVVLFVGGLFLFISKSRGSKFEGLYKEEEQMDAIKF